MSKSTRMPRPTVRTPLHRRLLMLVLALGLAVAATACASTPEGESRIKGVAGQDDGAAAAESGRLSPTAGLAGGAAGGQRPGEGSGGGLDGLTSGLGSDSGGSAPGGGSVSADLAGLPGAGDVLALIKGTMGGTYTIDYTVDPTVMDHMVISNEPGRQSIHSVSRDTTERWTLYDGVQMTVDCIKYVTGPWHCSHVEAGKIPFPVTLTLDPTRLVAGLSGLALSPSLVLAALAPPLEGTAGVASESYRTTIAGAPAQCLKYEMEKRPPAEVCANDDNVPVRLSVALTSELGTIPVSFQAQSYSRGVAPGAFDPPGPVV